MDRKKRLDKYNIWYFLKKKINIYHYITKRAGLEHANTIPNPLAPPEERINLNDRDRSRKRSCTPTGGANIMTFDAGSTALKGTLVTLENRDVSPRKV
jgi:hypothetical protein